MVIAETKLQAAKSTSKKQLTWFLQFFHLKETDFNRIFLGGLNMKKTIESLKTRIHLLKERDAVVNANIINKLNRQLRAAENSKNTGQE